MPSLDREGLRGAGGVAYDSRGRGSLAARTGHGGRWSAGLGALLVALAACSAETPHGEHEVPLIEVPPATAVAPGPVAVEAESPYNILLISLDTLRADGLGVYRSGRPTSPSIDAFAEEAVVFERAYSHSPKTATSHMTLFTGLLPGAHGVENWTGEADRPLSDGIPTMASLLKAAGYRTEAYTNGGNVDAALGFGRGFDRYVSDYGRRGALANFDDAGAAIRALGSKQDESRVPPFFLFVHTYNVHDPYVYPAEFTELFVDPRYSGDMIDSQEELRRAAGYHWPQRHRLFWASVDKDRPEDRVHLRDLYDAGIRATDELVAELLATLEDSGLAASTIVVILSDHGEEFFEHGGVLHETVYEEVIRVPLIIRLPAEIAEGRHGTRVSRTARLVDLAPTLLEIVGLPVPAHMQGSFLFAAGAEADRTPDFVLSQYLEVGIASLIIGPWKYVVRKRGSREELYNLDADPGETDNLASVNRSELLYLRSEFLELRRRDREVLGSAVRGARIDLREELREGLEALGYLGGFSKEKRHSADP